MLMLIPLVSVVLACGLVSRDDDPAEEPVVLTVTVLGNGYPPPMTTVTASGGGDPAEKPAPTEAPPTPPPPPTTGGGQPAPVPTEGPVVESTLVVTGEPPITVSGDLPLPIHAGDSLIEEKIIEYPVIVRATLASFSSDTFDYPGGYFRPVLQFTLNVIEYLGGTGPSSIVAVWFGPDYDTREEADNSRVDILAERDSQWDDREAVFFLSDPSAVTPPSTQPQLASQYSLGVERKYYADDRYSLHSESDKRWLPAVSGTGPGASKEFLLDVPPTTETITLGDLKKRIKEVTAEYNGGDGSERYKECVLEKYQYIRNQRNWPDEHGNPWGLWDLEYSLVSGQAAGTVLDQKEAYGGYPDIKLPYWIEGGDSALFDTADGASTVIDKDGDGEDDEDDVIMYYKMVRLARPLPSGEYKFDLRETHPRHMICNFVVSDEVTVTVIPPDGVVHELLFDPVTVGSAVTADGTNGVLKPATFTGGDGASATVESISYEAGEVKVKIVPWHVLSGKTLDFIELDGRTSMTLNVTKSPVEAASNTLTWPVSSQPWEDGDKLMVRIRRAAPFDPATVTRPGAKHQWGISLSPASAVRPRTVGSTLKEGSGERLGRGRTTIDVIVSVSCNGSVNFTKETCLFEPGSVVFEIRADGSEPGEATNWDGFRGPSNPIEVEYGRTEYVIRLYLYERWSDNGDTEFVPFVLDVDGQAKAEARFQIE